MSGVVWFVVLSFVLAAAAQSGGPPASGPLGLILPVPNAPFSARQVEERTRTAADGSLTTNVVSNPVYRDSAGRVRVEWRVSDLPTGTNEVIYLIDPVSFSVTVLFVGPKIAYRTVVPRSNAGGFQVGFPGLEEPFPEAEVQMKTESLGRRITEGVEVEGTRTTTTAKGEPILSAFRETWSSRALGLTVALEASGPDSRHTAKLQDLDHHEPDASLFIIPLGYSIQD